MCRIGQAESDEVMKTGLADKLGLEYPIFAFSHCRDVVAAVSRAGGLGVFGAIRYDLEQLDAELRWLDENTGGRPYGIDVVIPAKSAGDDLEALERDIPDEHRAFVAGLVKRFAIPPPKSEGWSTIAGAARHTRTRGVELLRLGLSHNVKVVASGLGPLPSDIVDEVHDAGAMVFGLAGQVKHGLSHVKHGADVVVAVGTEAAGHTGDVSTMVLVPDVVDAVSPAPVLAGGGIGTGRQIAAALTLGAEGVWMGSIWLTTKESDLDPRIQQKLLAAGSLDAVRSRCASGKPVRQLRTPWVEAWGEPGAPQPLSMPQQQLLVRDAHVGIHEHGVEAAMGTAVGQIVGRMNSIRSVSEVFYDLVVDFGTAGQRIGSLTQNA
jgi:NAD(P)H-dependent flavin oxidoreductase YrpB (nitropropane dioxygenase family)